MFSTIEVQHDGDTDISTHRYAILGSGLKPLVHHLLYGRLIKRRVATTLRDAGFDYLAALIHKTEDHGSALSIMTSSIQRPRKPVDHGHRRVRG